MFIIIKVILKEYKFYIFNLIKMDLKAFKKVVKDSANGFAKAGSVFVSEVKKEMKTVSNSKEFSTVESQVSAKLSELKKAGQDFLNQTVEKVKEGIDEFKSTVTDEKKRKEVVDSLKKVAEEATKEVKGTVSTLEKEIKNVQKAATATKKTPKKEATPKKKAEPKKTK